MIQKRNIWYQQVCYDNLITALVSTETKISSEQNSCEVTPSCKVFWYICILPEVGFLSFLVKSGVSLHV